VDHDTRHHTVSLQQHSILVMSMILSENVFVAVDTFSSML